MKTLKSILCLYFLFISSSLFATIWHVPDSCATIQIGIDSASTGDTVLVHPGTYNEHISISKNIVLGSLFLTTSDTSFISSTIIEPTGGGVVVNFTSGRDSTCIITGFTITGGNSQGYGAGIRCIGTSPTIINNIIKNNTINTNNNGFGCWGAGIYLENSANARIIKNRILNNTVTQPNPTAEGELGGGIFSRNSNPYIANNIINNNFALTNGGGIYFDNSQVRVYNNIISGNFASQGGGIYCEGNSYGVIKGNTFFADTAWGGDGSGSAGYFTSSGNIEFTNNIFHSNYGVKYALYVGSDQGQINNNTFCFNQGNISALFCVQDTIYNNIFYANLGIETVFGGVGTYYKNCDFWGNAGSNFLLPPPAGTGVLSTVNINGDSSDVFGNIFMDPLFADSANFDFHLTQNSPCIDAGDPNFPYDPDGTVADMGAFYYNQTFPRIAVSDTMMDFGIISVGLQSNLQLTMYSNGTGNLLITSITNQLPQFTHSWNSADSLIPPGDSLSILISFAPNDSLNYSDTLTIENNNHTQYVILTGSGFIPTFPIISISDSTLDFGIVEVGKHADSSFAIYNTGTDTLTISSLTNNQNVFTNNFSTTNSLILPGDSLAITVAFAPLDSGLILDTLSINNNDRILEIYLSGTGDLVNGINTDLIIPKEYALYPAYPNPFNLTTTIKFDLPKTEKVNIEVFNLLGQNVYKLVNKTMLAGTYYVKFNAKDLPRGVYFYKIKAGKFQKVKNMLLLK